MKVVARIVLGVVSLSLLSSVPALADPPPSNKNIEPFTFDCMRGSESRHFVAIGIGQSAQIAGQIQGTDEVLLIDCEEDRTQRRNTSDQVARPARRIIGDPARRDWKLQLSTCLRDVPWRAMSQAAEIERSRPGLALSTPKDASRLLARVPAVDAVGLEERAASLAKRSIKRESKLWALDLAIRCMDLTTLEGTDTVGKVIAMCAKAVRPNPVDPSIPSVAAVCLYPHLVPVALGQLKGTSVQVASVAGAFPAGLGPLGARLAEIREVVDLGAQEVDIVLNRSYFLGGQYAQCFEEIVAAREAAGNAHLKVILETGELGSYDRIRQASVLAMAAGADFIKTSTGKIGVNATLPAALCMMEAARDFFHETGRAVGVKVAGGVRASKQAIQYLVLVYETLGPEWMTPERFRIGASTLLNDVLMQIDKERTGRYQGPDYYTID